MQIAVLTMDFFNEKKSNVLVGIKKFGANAFIMLCSHDKFISCLAILSLKHATTLSINQVVCDISFTTPKSQLNLKYLNESFASMFAVLFQLSRKYGRG